MIKVLVFEIFLLVGSFSEFESELLSDGGTFGFLKDPRLHKNWNLLPHDTCGQVDSNRIIGGVEAPMNAYPWLVRIGYSYSNFKMIIFLCAGVIANSRTVVTAAHCAPSTDKGYKAKMIRFGEHNIRTNPDCDGNFCADPVLDIAISEILIPKNYSAEDYKHDIALIRLEKEIEFTAFIKPICFGSGEFLKKDYSGKLAEVAGWGIQNIAIFLPSVKLQVVKLPIINYTECSKYFIGKIKVGPTQICAGGVIGKDSCNGDSGGPLMIVDDGTNGPRYYLLGIVSFGSEKCGKTKLPGVYTNMLVYMKWFLDNLEQQNDDSIKIE